MILKKQNWSVYDIYYLVVFAEVAWENSIHEVAH